LLLRRVSLEQDPFSEEGRSRRVLTFVVCRPRQVLQASYPTTATNTIARCTRFDITMNTTDATPVASQSLEYGIHPSLDQFSVPYKTYLSDVPKDPFRDSYDWIVVGAVVFDSGGRILLIQRSAKDFFPNLWEIPGGGCEEVDESIIHTVVRELREETGLQARGVGPMVGVGYCFPISTGKIACKYSFVVGIDDQSSERGSIDVQLDPNEHQNHVWVTEQDVRAGRIAAIELKFTSAAQEKVILEAFELRKAVQE